MPSWPKSNSGAEKPAKVKPAKTPKAPKAQIVIAMPRRTKEFGMGTFGTEPMDTITPAPVECPQLDQDTLSGAQTQAQEQTPTSTSTTPSAHPQTSPSSQQQAASDDSGDPMAASVPRSPSLSCTPSPALPETKRQRQRQGRQGRQDIPPAIVTSPESTAPTHPPSHLYHVSAQTSSTPQTPFPHASQQDATPAATAAVAPASSLASATTAQTHKTPGSMSEWRMMQMQLQQQDDLHFALPVSLTIPPVSSHSRHHYGLPPLAVAAGSAAVSISSSSACSCLRCCSVPSPSEPLAERTPEAAAPVAGTQARTDDAGTVTQHHSFLLHPHSPNHVLSAAAGLEARREADEEPAALQPQPSNSAYAPHHPNHSFLLEQHPHSHSIPLSHSHPLPHALPHAPSQQPQLHPIHPLYSHGNISSASSDYFSSRDIHPQCLGLGNATLGGSTATLNSDCPPSSVDPLDYDHPYTHPYTCTHHPNGSSGCYGQCSSPHDASAGTFLNYPYLRPAPASAVGGTRPKHCRNCPQQQSRRPSLGAAGSALGSPVLSTTAAFSPALMGGVEMELSASGTSFTNSLHSCSNAVRRQSSPSLGPFRSLSSKIAATTIKKLSGSQKSLFSASRDDLLSAGCQCCQESAEWGSPQGSGGCCCCSRGRGGAGGSGCGGSGSDGIWATNNNSGGGGGVGNKVQRMQSKLNSLRGGNGRNHSKDRGSKGSRKSPGDMEYGHSYVPQEFAQYNYERQMEDFQRAARVFKEQKALTSAAAAASIAAEARAAVKEAATAAAAAAAAEAGRSKKSEITPIDESEEGNNTSPTDPCQPLSPRRSLGSLTEGLQNYGNGSKEASDALRAPSPKPRKKSLAPSSRSSLFQSSVRPPRRMGSTSGSITSGKASQRINYGNVGGFVSRTSSIHRVDGAYPEMGQTGKSIGADLRLSGLGIGLGIGSGFCLDSMGFDSYARGASNASDIMRSGSVDSYGQDGYTNAYDEIPMLDMAPSSIHPSRTHPRRYEEVQSLKGRLSSVSQDTRGLGGTFPRSMGTMRTGRSVHSVCSVDTVSQQIAARHHQHSRLANLSNVASLHSQSAAMHSNCESIGATAGGDGAMRGAGCAASKGGIVLENSPIQVVRATVGTVDDSSLPCFTFRMWVLSTVFVIMGAAISEYNFFRTNSAYFSVYFVQLASYFLGKAMARWLPTREFEIWIPRWSCTPARESDSKGSRSTSSASRNSDCSADEIEADTCSERHQSTSGDMAEEAIHDTERSEHVMSKAMSIKAGLGSDAGAGASRRWISKKFTLNPGKFNMKEHMLIGIAAAAGCSPAYATNVLAIQSLIFNAPLGSLTGVGLVISSQCIGFSMAWFLFDYVIKPSVMIWPATLVNVSLYNTLHEHKVLTRWFTRMQLFWYAFFAIFIYQWLPRMFMPVLTSMALLCWIKPSSNVLRKLGSGYTGLGMGCISLDWSIISGVGPLYTPWWAQCNFFVGLIVMLWIVTPIVYFTNYWSAMSYPIVSSNLYDSNSQLYDISKIVNADLSFNITMYKNYSPVIMTPYFAITYGTSFMAVIATFVHVALFYGADIWLISTTRFGRKMRQIRHPGFVVSIVKAIWGVDPEPVVEEQQQHDVASEVYMSEYGYGFAGTDGLPTRRNSEALSFMNSGMSIAGADDRSALNQPSHYRRMSQQQQQQQPSGFIPTMAQTPARCNKPVDERAQIPTEMFGTEDIHTSLMREYPEIPGWWFGVLFLVCFVMAVLVCKTSEIRLPVYALILALMLAAVFALPMAIIQALSSSQIGLNVLSEVVCGYLLPGNQLGNSVFKCYSYMALYQCLNLTQGFKLGHYMKVPPRHIMIAVLYGTLVGAFVNLQVLDWVLVYNRQELFEANPKSGWSFRNLDLFFSASLLWGAISPVRLFEEGSIYHFLPYCFLIGVLLPIPCYLMHRHYLPYGAMCKGSSVFPFLPKCNCPAAHPSASSSPQTDISGPTAVSDPTSHPSDRMTSGQVNDDLHLETGRSDNDDMAAGRCWPFAQMHLSRHSRRQKEFSQDNEDVGGDDKTGLDGGTGRSPAVVAAAVSAPPTTTGDHGTTRKSEPPPPEPHLYYGHPDRWWEGRLRRMPWHLVNTPLICVGASFVPQAPASFVVSAGVVAFCFAFLVLRYRHEWWRRYTYVLAAALDAGTQICNMAIFVVFALILKGAVGFPSWFGNDAVNPEKCGVGDGYN
ncbi:hypothetical protein EC968_009095 [Mortierella alpina]|nr:hypothetical protein EC968_009095 [Mortierella alpina]